jgi:hypothetical protein
MPSDADLPMDINPRERNRIARAVASDAFLHRKRVKPNGQVEEITLGSSFARTLIALFTLIGIIILTLAGANATMLLSAWTKLIGA